jgi:hypothetical protein
MIRTELHHDSFDLIKKTQAVMMATCVFVFLTTALNRNITGIIMQDWEQSCRRDIA